MNNPRAFPSSSDSCVHLGMTLLDYFAGQAMQALVTSLGDPQHREAMFREGRSLKDVPIVAYEIAEAMLAERERRQK